MFKKSNFVKLINILIKKLLMLNKFVFVLKICFYDDK
jgi:hypothetical protein